MSQLCTFFLGDQAFGLEVEQVREVVRYTRITPVPLAPPLIRGLINLRGEIIPVVDLRRRLGFEVLEPSERSFLVVAVGEGGQLALLVDDVGEVIDVESSQLERPPPNLRSPMSELVESICKLEGQLLLILNSQNTQLLPKLETLHGVGRSAGRQGGMLDE